MKRTKRIFSILLALALGLALLIPAAAGSAFELRANEKPWWIMPWWLRLGYFANSLKVSGFLEDSVLIYHDGKLVYEKYNRNHGPEVPHLIQSITKTVLAVLTGAAIHDGLIEGLDQKVVDFYPDAVIAGQESKLDMTIGHLLAMTSGLPMSQDCFKAEDAGLAAFESPQWYAPGAVFQYTAGANAQCLVGVIERAAGMNLLEYAHETLFGPLGITSVTWETTDNGSPIGGFGMAIERAVAVVEAFQALDSEYTIA